MEPLWKSELGIKVAVRRATALLSKYNVVKPAVLVEKIAMAEEVFVFKRAVDANYEGRLIVGPGGLKEILVNKKFSKHEHRDRFTIAHELGHFIMCPETRIHFRCPTQDIGMTAGQRIEERIANTFAAELLMPEDLYRADMKKDGPIIKRLAKLAKDYNVSPWAASIRFVTFSQEAIGIICYDFAGRHRWHAFSDGWKDLFGRKYLKKPVMMPADSLAAQYISSAPGQRGRSDIDDYEYKSLPFRVYAEWFPRIRYMDGYFREEVFYLPALGYILSVLRVEET